MEGWMQSRQGPREGRNYVNSTTGGVFTEFSLRREKGRTIPLMWVEGSRALKPVPLLNNSSYESSKSLKLQ